MSKHQHDCNVPGHSHDGGDHHQLTPEQEEEEERKALGRIAAAMRQYQDHAEWEIQRWAYNYSVLPPSHKALLSHLPCKFAAAQQAAQTNTHFFKALLSIYHEDNHSVAPHLAIANAAADEWQEHTPRANGTDMEKVRYVLKNVWRDWSEEGAQERQQSFGRICKELRARLGEPPQQGAPPPHVLVPGCGLARLCCEIAGLGYAAQGNEFSYFMLLASSFMLNHVTEAAQWTIHPWLLSNCNQQSDDDQLRGVPVPDKHPTELIKGPNLLSMAAGDFVECYADPQCHASFDAVATCFFIDTAHNIVTYMQVILDVLKEGGYWVNMGPLLYHWADSHAYVEGGELSLELSLEDVMQVAGALGFELIHKEMVEHVPYMTNPKYDMCL